VCVAHVSARATFVPFECSIRVRLVTKSYLSLQYLNCLDVPTMLSGVCCLQPSNLALTNLFFSLLINFRPFPFKISKQLFNWNNLFGMISSSFFLLIIVLFGIIYKTRILFNFIPFQFFLSFKFSPHSFDCYLFCLR